MKLALAWGCGVGSLAALDALAREGDDITLLHVLTARSPPDFVVEDQAAALDLPLVLARVAPGEAETDTMRRALGETSAESIAFGYLRGEEYAGMFKVARASRGAGAEPLLPVRHVRPDEAARALAESGHRIFVRAVDAPLPSALLGRFLDAEFVDEIEGAHGRHAWSQLRTLAVDGPRFARRVDVVAGDPEPANGGSFLVLSLRGC